MNFHNDSILFKDIKLSPVNDFTVKQQIPECITAITLSVFSDTIASFTRNIRSNFNNQLKEGRARFKYFPGAT